MTLIFFYCLWTVALGPFLATQFCSNNHTYQHCSYSSWSYNRALMHLSPWWSTVITVRVRTRSHLFLLICCLASGTGCHALPVAGEAGRAFFSFIFPFPAIFVTSAVGPSVPKHEVWNSLHAACRVIPRTNPQGNARHSHFAMRGFQLVLWFPWAFLWEASLWKGKLSDTVGFSLSARSLLLSAGS